MHHPRAGPPPGRGAGAWSDLYGATCDQCEGLQDSKPSPNSQFNGTTVVVTVATLSPSCASSSSSLR